MPDPGDLQLRIEEAARKRAELDRARNPNEGRRATGYVMQLQQARAEREKALAQRAAEKASDVPPMPLDLGARLREKSVGLDEASGRIDARSSQLLPKSSIPAPVTASAPQPDTQDVADVHHASTPRAARLGKFCTGLTAGLAACVAVLVVASSVSRELSGQFDGGANVPVATVHLADLLTPAAPSEPVSLPTGRDGSSAEIVARAGINPLTSPSPLGDVPNLVSIPRGAMAMVAGTDALPASLPAPPAQETAQYGTHRERDASALPGLDAVRAGLPPNSVDPLPTIGDMAVMPDVRGVEIALAPPPLGPEPSVSAGTDLEPAEVPRVIQMAALHAQDVADVLPDFARSGGRAGATSVQVRAPAVTVAPDLVAAWNLRSSDIPSSHRSIALPQGLPNVASDRERTVDLERIQPSRPASMSALETVAASLPNMTASAVAIPDRDRSLERSIRVAALPGLGTEAPFDRQAVKPATAPRLTARAVFTLSSESEIDADWLNRIGVDVAQVQVSHFPISRTRVYYFHGEDADDAKAVASRLGGDVVDMTSVIPSPPSGLLEVQLSD